jgi:hypothetical protein
MAPLLYRTLVVFRSESRHLSAKVARLTKSAAESLSLSAASKASTFFLTAGVKRAYAIVATISWPSSPQAMASQTGNARKRTRTTNLTFIAPPLCLPCSHYRHRRLSVSL